MKKEIRFNRRRPHANRSRWLFPLIAVGVVAAGLVSFLIIMAENDFSFSRFIGVREAGETTAPAQETQPGPEAATAAPFTDPNAVNVLFYCTEGVTPSFMELVCFSASENAVRVKPLALDGVYDRDGEPYALRELFSSIGVSAVTDALRARGYPVRRYVGFSETNFKRLLLRLGDVTVNVPHDVSFKAQAITYTLSAGPQVLKPDILVQYMKHAYSGDDKLRAEGAAFAEILRTHLTAENVGAGEAFFSDMVNYADTDISMFDYQRARDALTAMLEASPAFTVIS